MTEWLHFHFSLPCIGEGNGNPLQRSCLENPRDGGAWWAAVYGVAQSRTRLKRLSSSSSSRSAVVLHILCFGIAEISLVVLKMEFLILLPPREGETAALYWAIIYSRGNFLIWTFSNLHRSRKHSMVNFFHSPITCFCIYQNFVKPGSSISTQFFPQSILKEIPNIILLYPKIFQYTSSRPF